MDERQVGRARVRPPRKDARGEAAEPHTAHSARRPSAAAGSAGAAERRGPSREAWVGSTARATRACRTARVVQAQRRAGQRWVRLGAAARARSGAATSDAALRFATRASWRQRSDHCACSMRCAPRAQRKVQKSAKLGECRPEFAFFCTTFQKLPRNEHCWSEMQPPSSFRSPPFLIQCLFPSFISRPAPTGPPSPIRRPPRSRRAAALGRDAGLAPPPTGRHSAAPLAQLRARTTKRTEICFHARNDLSAFYTAYTRIWCRR